MNSELQHVTTPVDPRDASRRTFALRRLVLLVTVCALGLPVLVQPTAFAASAPTPLVTQIAKEPVSVSAAEFRRHLFVAADAARLSDPSNTADLLAERVLQHMYALDAHTDPAAAATAVQKLRRAAASVTGPAFDSRITRTLVLFQQAAAADQGPVAVTLQRATTEVVSLAARQVGNVAASTHAENALGTTGDTESRLLASATFTPTSVLLDSATLADADTRYAAARDAVWAGVTGVSITATSATLLARAPRLKDNADVQALAALRDQAGNLRTTGGVIAGAPGNPAPHTIGSTVAALDRALDTTRQSAQASTGSSPSAPDVSAQAVEQARDSQTALALQSGMLTGGTSAAKDIVDQVGATAVQVTLLAMSFNDFSSGTIGRAALSGNVLGVVMTLLPGVLEAAGVFGPSAEDLMMTQLDNISQQMADFQNAVNGQFAQVFDSLSRVSDQLSDISRKLDRAVIDIEQARVQIGQMYDSLSRLQGSLDAVQNNILDALRNGTNSQLRETISSALGYQERNHSPLPLSEFNSAAAFLHTFATVTARHSPELNTDHPSFDPQNDANQLSTGIASNVDFLDQLPSKRDWTADRLSGTTGDEPQLANLDDYVLAARAYAQLMLENPRYVSAGYRRWLNDIQQLGGPLADLTSAISTSDTTDGTRSTLLNHLVCARTSAAFTPTYDAPACQEQSEDAPPVGTAMSQSAKELSESIPGYDGPGNPTTTSPLSIVGGGAVAGFFDPFQHTASGTSDLTALWSTLPGRDTVAQCAPGSGESAGTLGSMDRPPSLTPDSQGVPRDYQWADRMGLGRLNVCYEVSTRSLTVTGCQFGDQWMAVNLLSSTRCAKTFWRRSDVSSETGSPTTVTYKYDDTAFVWTYTPAGRGSEPVYVQSLDRRGGATSPAYRSSVAELYLPRGGYVRPTGSPTLVDYSDIKPAGSKFELTNVQAAPLYTARTTAAAVREAWDDATTTSMTTEGSHVVFSFQDVLYAIPAGDPVDQPVGALDPKLGTIAAKYARTCTDAEQASGSTVCETGTGGARFVSQASAKASVRAALDAKLVVLQGDAYRKLLSGTQPGGSTTSGPLHDALVRLDGANAMLSSYLQLGASQALRQHDLTGLPVRLAGSKALVSAIKTQVARTTAGETATDPYGLVLEVLDPGALTGLDGLLPEPSARSGRLASASSSSSSDGPVNPALLATNDQLALTAVALGAPASVTPTPDPTPKPTPTPTPKPTPPLVVQVALTNPLVSGARVHHRYTARIIATGGTGTYTWSRRGALPRGLSGRPTQSTRVYEIRGVPKKRGLVRFTLTATDTAGKHLTKRLAIRVRHR